MKCPGCSIELADDMIEAGLCFECGSTFPAMKSKATLLREKEEELAKAKEEERIRIELEAKRLRELAEKEEKERIAKEWRAAHPDADGRYYEYRTIKITDNASGHADAYQIERTLNQMGYEGWRLVTALTNEIGKTSHTSGYAGISSGTNATIDETILIFERVAKID